MGDLTGKVAVITGAGRGLGREEAIQFARQGARVVINDIDRPEAVEAAQSAVEEIKGFGGEAMVVLGDCADSSDAENLMKSTLDAYGDMNIMVNNAGFCRDKTIFGMSDDEFDSVVRVHLRGHFVNMRNATAYWRDKAKSGEDVYGRLISTSSEAAIYGSAGQPNYAAAKAGIIAMTMGAAQLLTKYGITCNVIMPRALAPVAGLMATVARLTGRGRKPTPSTSRINYALTAAFEDNTLTRDRAMWDFMRRQMTEVPALAIGAPTMQWFGAALGWHRAW